jgi:hypothetical protein
LGTAIGEADLVEQGEGNAPVVLDTGDAIAACVVDR